MKNLPKKKADLQEVVVDIPAAHFFSSISATVKTLTKAS